jgi:alkyl hydroperoxide reductase subunit AhpC
MKYLCLLLALISVALSIAPRQFAPDFSALAVLPDNSFATLKLSDFRGKYVVLLFYPFDFTYVCPTEIISYSSRANDFKRISALI